jgi:hypothetical protein
MQMPMNRQWCRVGDNACWVLRFVAQLHCLFAGAAVVAPLFLRGANISVQHTAAACCRQELLLGLISRDAV